MCGRRPKIKTPLKLANGKLGWRERQRAQRKAQAGRYSQDGKEAIHNALPVCDRLLEVLCLQHQTWQDGWARRAVTLSWL